MVHRSQTTMSPLPSWKEEIFVLLQWKRWWRLCRFILTHLNKKNIDWIESGHLFMVSPLKHFSWIFIFWSEILHRYQTFLLALNGQIVSIRLRKQKTFRMEKNFRNLQFYIFIDIRISSDADGWLDKSIRDGQLLVRPF